MKRSEVNINETWDLSGIYESVEKYNQDLESFQKSVEDFVSKYKNNLKTVEDVNASILDFSKISVLQSKLGSYASLPLAVDAFDEDANKRYVELVSVASKLGAQLSFYENELLSLDENLLIEAGKEEVNKVFVENLLAQKAHCLSTEVESALASLTGTLSLPYRLYDETKMKDIAFPDYEANGQTHSLNYNLYEGELEHVADIEVRRNSAKTFYDTLSKYQHTTAAIYNGQVQKEKTLSELRGYSDVFEYLLQSQKVDKSLYNRQMDVIMSDLAPHMRKYAKIIKGVHKLDEIRYSDLKVDLDPGYSQKVSFEKAREYIIDGLSILGEDYLELMNHAFDNRSIDYANNEGKSTGAFCATPYGTQSYILMSFNENMSDVMTLAHELGHAGHFLLANKHQNILNADCSMYFVEAPSTANELIVSNHLLKVAEEKGDLRMKRWVLTQMVAKTYYHNFVTHLLEAWYQREVYKLVDQGDHVNANTLSTIFKDTLTKFWGDEVILEENNELTWMRQPHYYMGLYPYTYSAGLTIGTQVAKNIFEQGTEFANNWKEVLKTGGSKSPLELAKMAGVDVSTDAPLKDTIAYIGSLIDEIERISIELGEL